MVSRVGLDERGLAAARKCLAAGGIVAFPTESAYALGAWVGARAALERLERLKSRPPGQGFPVLVPSVKQARRLLASPAGAGWDLATQGWPGGLTLVAPGGEEMPPQVTSDLGVGLRVTGHPWAGCLIREFDRPVTCTSANRRGDPPAYTSSDIPEELLEAVDMVVEGRSGGQDVSTVITPRAWGVVVLRQGPVKIPEEVQITDDTAHRGRVRLLQPKKGYRFSVDALLLAGYVEAEILGNQQLSKKQEVSAVELGAGCGVVSLCLLSSLRHRKGDATGGRSPAPLITALEIQPRLADLAQLNAELNSFQEQFYLRAEDYTLYLREKKSLPWVKRPLDLVFSNPPYRTLGSGRVSPDKEKEIALGEEACTMEDVVRFGAYFLAEKGVLCVIYPTARLAELVSVCASSRLYLRRLKPVYSKFGVDSKRVLATFGKKDPSRVSRVEGPLIMYQSGEETAALKAIVDGIRSPESAPDPP